MLVGQLLLAKHWDSNNKLDTSLEEIKALPSLIEEALKCEDQVKEISKLIYKKKDKHGTEFALSALPLGGYVSMITDKLIEVEPEIKDLTIFLKKMGIKNKIVSHIKINAPLYKKKPGNSITRSNYRITIGMLFKKVFLKINV